MLQDPLATPSVRSSSRLAQTSSPGQTRWKMTSLAPLAPSSLRCGQPGNPQLKHESWLFLRCQECFAVNFTGARSDSLQCIQGHPDSVATALRIICDGIARYKELCEGAYNGMPSSSPSLHMYNQEKGFDSSLRGAAKGWSFCSLLKIGICAHAGHLVSRLQIIHGIAFSYQPPPRTIVPHAAGLKGQGNRWGIF